MCASQTPIENAIEAASIALGRRSGEEERKLSRTLRENWYFTAGDVVSMTEGEATALGIPLRLKSVLVSLINAAGEISEPPASMENPRDMNVDISVDNGAYLSLDDVHRVDSGSDGNQRCVDGSNKEENVVEDSSSKTWIPIEQRVCPYPNRFGFDSSTIPRVTNRAKAIKYAVHFPEMSNELQRDFEGFHKFSTTRFFGQQCDPIAAVTAEKYADHIRGMLGWLHAEREVPIEELRLKSLVPSSERDGVALAFDFQQWLADERRAAMSTQLLFLRSMMQCAKYLYHDKSKIRPGSGDKSYSDLGVIKELRAMISATNKASKVSPRVAEESLKWLDWPEYLRLVAELEKEVAGIRPSGQPRTRSAVARSLQLYLMFAILASFPDRQRTLRELRLGKTLFKVEDRYMIKHSPSDYKTGKVYGERAPLVLPASLTPYLDEFINIWRKELNPKQDLLFCQVGGGPLTDKGCWKVFMRNAYRITGKRCHPHLVRDSIVTYLRSGNATETELEALALLMGHSVEMQRSSYDRRTKEAKVEPAVALLESLNNRI